MAVPFVPRGREGRNLDRQRHLEHVGYQFREVDGGWILTLQSPSGENDIRYKNLGSALNRAEKDIRLARSLVSVPGMSIAAREFWYDILKRYDHYGSFEGWAERQFGRTYETEA